MSAAPARAALWRWTRRAAPWIFFALVAALLWRHARATAWHAVFAAVGALPLRTLLAAAALAGASYLLFASYDLIGRWLTRHRLPRRTVMGVALISYAFNLNLGALVGGVAFRVRLYARFGLDGETTARVLATSMLGNWIGYLALAGALMLFAPPALPPNWPLGEAGLRILGALMLFAAASWPLLCATARGRRWRVFGHTLTPPPVRAALLQIALAAGNWALMGAILWLLLRGQIAYPQVLAVLLAAAVAGVVTHVPAGLGVLEGVFIALLGGALPRPSILAALLAYRAVYYLLPLLLAGLGYGVLELRARGAGGQAPIAKPSARPDAA